ncbi:arsenate reductase (arsenical pump modifier) [Salmonella enterica subsp. salamae]|nr:arsenate reductase (arsenical pump modifier) [Salmonella enterica subsp. salamae]
MTDTIKIYHNPRCSKSRDTLNLLKSNGVEPEVVLYHARRCRHRA